MCWKLWKAASDVDAAVVGKDLCCVGTDGPASWVRSGLAMSATRIEVVKHAQCGAEKSEVNRTKHSPEDFVKATSLPWRYVRVAGD